MTESGVVQQLDTVAGYHTYSSGILVGRCSHNLRDRTSHVDKSAKGFLLRMTKHCKDV